MVELANKQILIVTTNLVFQEKVSGLLSNLGFNKVKSCNNYKEAIIFFFVSKPIMLFIDLDLLHTNSGIKSIVNLKYYQSVPFTLINSNLSVKEDEYAKGPIPVAFVNMEITKVKLIQLIQRWYGEPQFKKLLYAPASSSPFSKDFFIKIGNVLKKIPLKDIEWFGIKEKYAYLRMKEKEFPLNIYLKELEQTIPSTLFMRVHQSYIINTDKIDSINIINSTVIIGGIVLPIGRSYKKKIFKEIQYF